MYLVKAYDPEAPRLLRIVYVMYKLLQKIYLRKVGHTSVSSVNSRVAYSMFVHTIVNTKVIGTTENV